MPGSSQRLTHNDYTVGWICALPKTELVAAEAMLDEEHPVLPAAQPEDENTYSLGRIGDHNVVIACLPAEQTGKASAATVAKDMLRSFPAVRFGLMVGIGGGAPYYGSQSDDEVYSDSEEESDDDIRDIRLGDAVISLHTKETEAVVQYDFGKSLQENKFVRSGGQLNKPPRVVLNAVARLQGQHVRKGSTIPELLKEALDKYPLIADSFRYPLRAKDRLFKPDAVHQEGRKSCKACCGPDNINLVSRPDRATTAPSIHYGTIGSADQVMKDAVLRDQWAEKENIICFEMEAAGLMDSYPCLVIRGICDYADSHKNKTWQPYAAATAASCAKELLLLMPGQDVAGLTPIKQMSNQLARIEESTREVKHTIFYSQEEKQRKEILSSLSTLDYNTRHIDIFSRRTEGTGTWFVNTSSFITWRDTPGQTLYCPGIPGAGKTVLTSVIIDHIRPTLHDNNAALAFIYCAYNDRMKAEDLIRSLLKQIASQVPFVPNEVKNLADIYKSPNKPTPRANDVIQTLRSLTSRFARVYVVIDALDECSDDDRTDLLDALNKLRPLMNILVTSRPVASIKVSLRADLEQCIAAANDDIISYVEAQITGKRLKLSDELFKKPELRSQIVSELVASAKGMFLHARFHMEQLAPKHNILDLRNALKNLPKTSEEVYEKAMERVQSQDNETVSLANRTLQCVIGAVRFLHIHELQHALAVREGDYDIDEEALTAPNHLLSICAGLLTLNEEDGVIRLVHYTAQEFFKKHEHKYFSDAQEELTSICLTYLSLGVFDIDYQDYIRGDPDLWAERYALFEYAATNMGEHASGGIKGVMLQEAVKLFLNENKVTIAADTALTEYQHLGLFDLPDGFTGIHYASYLGLPDVIGQLFEQDWESIDRGDSYGRSSLSWAAERGHKAAVKLLLDTDKVNVDSQDRDCQTPLSYAAKYGHEAVVKLLLDTDKVDVDSQDRDRQTPLSYAAENGHEAVLKLLLDTGKVDVDSQDRDRQTPLSYAAVNGHEAAVKLLLDTGKVDVDSQDRYRQTPLLYAAKYGHEAVVKLLLDTGRLDVELQNVYGKTPLSWAAERGHEAVLKLLLDTDKVKFDSKDEFGRTPLSDAARQGHEAVVMLLLGTGKVDLDSKDESGRTPLSWAAEEGHEAVVKLLLEAGRVDLDSKDESGRTPLSWAAEEGHEAVVKLLLETGRVDIMLKDEDDWTPLEWAEENGHKEVVELLCHDGKMDVD